MKNAGKMVRVEGKFSGCVSVEATLLAQAVCCCACVATSDGQRNGIIAHLVIAQKSLKQRIHVQRTIRHCIGAFSHSVNHSEEHVKTALALTLHHAQSNPMIFFVPSPQNSLMLPAKLGALIVGSSQCSTSECVPSRPASLPSSPLHLAPLSGGRGGRWPSCSRSGGAKDE